MKVFKPSEVKQLRQSRLSLVLKKTSEARKDKCFVAGLGVFKNVQNSPKKSRNDHLGKFLLVRVKIKMEKLKYNFTVRE